MLFSKTELTANLFLKIWRYLPGVSIPNKKDAKETPQKADSREYEKTRSRKFSSKRQVGRPWLKDDENSMTCEWCMENKQTLISQSVLTSSKFIDGCSSYKTESIAHHENSAAHKLASQCHKANKIQKKTPAYLARQQLLNQYSGKLRLRLRLVQLPSIRNQFKVTTGFAI